MAKAASSVTRVEYARLFRVMDDPMGAESSQQQDDPLEQTELVRRLRRMQWPPAPPEVKQRVLERIVEQSDGELSIDTADSHGGSGTGK